MPCGSYQRDRRGKSMAKRLTWVKYENGNHLVLRLGGKRGDTVASITRWESDGWWRWLGLMTGDDKYGSAPTVKQAKADCKAYVKECLAKTGGRG